MKKVVGIIGASGLIGAELAKAFENLGLRVVRISRSRRRTVGQEWRQLDESSLRGLDVLVNLAGESVSKRWSKQNRQKFHASRVGLTKQVASWISVMPKSERPELWVNASAVGFYGDGGALELDESSGKGEGYLAGLCADWEAATRDLEAVGCRVVIPRIGVVLGRGAPAWVQMRKVFSLGLGGCLGRGRQWFPWVHLDDAVGAIVELSLSADSSGAYNIVAPNSVTNAQFTERLGAGLRRPTFCRVPSFMLRVVLGEFSTALLASQRVIPSKLREFGYEFRYGTLDESLSELLGVNFE